MTKITNTYARRHGTTTGPDGWRLRPVRVTRTLIVCEATRATGNTHEVAFYLATGVMKSFELVSLRPFVTREDFRAMIKDLSGAGLMTYDALVTLGKGEIECEPDNFADESDWNVYAEAAGIPAPASSRSNADMIRAPSDGGLKSGQIHRFRDFAALYLSPRAGKGQTVYMSALWARKIAGYLIECADDIEARAFTDSTFSSAVIEPSAIQESAVAPGDAFVYVQEGGSSTEIYLSSHDSEMAAQEGRISCAQSSYRTSAIVEVPSTLNNELFYVTVEEILRASLDFEYVSVPEDNEDGE
jgi:hypothetical protein